MESWTGIVGMLYNFQVSRDTRIYYICSKTRLTENVFLLTPALTLTLKHNNVFGMTKVTSFFEKVYRYQNFWDYYICSITWFSLFHPVERHIIHF